MDEKPPAEEDRESTPLLKRPVQTEVIYIDKNIKWVKKTPEQKKQYIANLLRARAQRLSEESRAPNDSPSVPTPALTDESPAPNTSASPPTPTPTTPIPDQFPPVQSTSDLDPTLQQSALRLLTACALQIREKLYNVNTNPTETSAPPTIAAAIATAGRSSGAPSEETLESLLQSSEVDDEFISLINIPSDSSETILTERVVYIVDSGGQPEFVEAMAVFLGKTSACILVIDLSQSLDHHALIGYYRKGKAVSKPYRCIRTNEENLKQCMRNFATITSKSKGPLTKLLLLGTHLDRIHECDTETVADKNARLKKIIPPQFEKQVIRVDDKTLIFEINALNPNDTDKKTAEKVRSYIMEQCPAVEVEIPMRWHAFEEKLRSLAESLGRMVMSRNECWLVAESLGLDEASFDGALDFFHRVSLMFYFHDILPHIVFIDPQVMLDKVSELIEFMFELREPKDEDESTPDTTPAATTSSGAAASTPKELPVIPSTTDVDLLPPGWLEFNRFGHITKQFLNSKRFSSHYHTDIFTSDDLIHLLEEVLVFAKLSTDEGPDTWFMPSVLKQVSAVKMGEVCVSAGPLVVNFPDGGPQNGIFCSLMSHVLSPLNLHPCPWKLHLASNEPTCLYRDCIKFQVPKYAGSVTLIDRYEFFEVHVFTSEEEMQELWQHTQNAIFSGITTVRDTLGYSNNKPHPAIICPNTTHTDKTHPAYIKNEKWICTSDSCVFGKLRDLNTDFHWCGVTCKPQPTSSSVSTSSPVPPSVPSHDQPTTHTLGKQQPTASNVSTVPSSAASHDQPSAHTLGKPQPTSSSVSTSSPVPPSAPSHDQPSTHTLGQQPLVSVVPTPLPATSHQPSTATADEQHTEHPLDIDDLFEVQCDLLDVAHKWKELGKALRLRPSVLNRIEADRPNVNSRLEEVLTEWLQQAYNTDRFGLPSWKLLVAAVAHPAGGNDHALARRIAEKHNVPPPPHQS